MYKERARWSTCGQGTAEQLVAEMVHIGETTTVKGTLVNELISLKNKGDFDTPITFVAKPKESYLLYYNYHCNSGYQTIFKADGSFDIVPPRGGVLPAFFSEVVILEETGKIIEFKRK